MQKRRIKVHHQPPMAFEPLTEIERELVRAFRLLPAKKQRDILSCAKWNDLSKFKIFEALPFTGEVVK